MWLQKKLLLKPRPRGFHLITREILDGLPELQRVEIGIAHFFLQHTSASLTINENADPSVRRDFESFLNQSVPLDFVGFTHTQEGPDDMPAHLKSSLLGSELSVPVGSGKLLLGVWQGIYLGEHRNHGGARSLMITLQGD